MRWRSYKKAQSCLQGIISDPELVKISLYDEMDSPSANGMTEEAKALSLEVDELHLKHWKNWSLLKVVAKEMRALYNKDYCKACHQHSCRPLCPRAMTPFLHTTLRQHTVRMRRKIHELELKLHSQYGVYYVAPPQPDSGDKSG